MNVAAHQEVPIKPKCFIHIIDISRKSEEALDFQVLLFNEASRVQGKISKVAVTKQWCKRGKIYIYLKTHISSTHMKYV